MSVAAVPLIPWGRAGVPDDFVAFPSVYRCFSQPRSVSLVASHRNRRHLRHLHRPRRLRTVRVFGAPSGQGPLTVLATTALTATLLS
jgi:hypothetical protein